MTNHVFPAPTGRHVKAQGIAPDLGRKTMASPRREVNFPLAGSAGPGFHTWPSGHISQDNGSETTSSHPVPCQKDVRRGVRRRDCSRVRGPRFPHLALRPHLSRHGCETASSHPAPGKKTFGEAFGEATVAGSAGPGFHTWPSGHIPQETAAKPLLRIRPPGKKTFGEAFGAATGVSDPRLQKSRGARATTLGPYRYETTTQVS